MAQFVLDPSSSTIQFSVREISKLTMAWSPPVILYGIPWTVCVEKYENGAEKSLDVSLQCDIDHCILPLNWTATACATVKLLRFNGGPHTIEDFISPFVFHRFARAYGIRNLIHWDDLFNPFNNYVKNDRIKLEVQIKAEDPNDVNRSVTTIRCIDQSCECCCHAIYRMDVMNISQLMAVQSPEFTMRARPYEILLFKNGADLGIRLRLNRSYVTAHHVKMSIELLSSNSSVVPIRRTGSVEEIDIISWHELFNPHNGYVNGNAIRLKIEINVNDVIDKIPIQFECSMCSDDINGQYLSHTSCGHLFCVGCIAKVSTFGSCPLCAGRSRLP